jgi:hypothetical protein
MIENNRLDKAFGPVGSSSGVFLFIGGLIIAWFSWIGILLALLGAFSGFTSTSTVIDYEKRRIKFSNNLFGIIRTGKWINIDPEMKIGLSKNKRGWKSYSRGGVPLSISDKDFRLILYGSGDRQIIPVKKTDSIESARSELESISGRLGIGII